ncbi:hypothetical protein PISMIDRAFT_350965 [Pisolithus microcarpus 441]|uniref:Uncharacterized protein n=1 Tax=Pisolithus microcarpus 441 TaxID=765257 RepID=A0A0C9XQL2_9AGAM|nr:hypothetical protein PISMIDRAFT_350965 [Pisolithus microcarpus 441]
MSLTEDSTDDPLITIHPVFRGSTCFRIFDLSEHSGKMEIKEHLLRYREAKYRSPSNCKSGHFLVMVCSQSAHRQRIFPAQMSCKPCITMSHQLCAYSPKSSRA